ncbi:hypothetical protein [Chryseobacterium sp.]|uniref:hypothetical protein n=1 Tax=Chryseobacterium sp. TaxID=1871047 RepID=UPI00261C70BE|nr:hypothetical protein [Chryseobacterium sp.]
MKNDTYYAYLEFCSVTKKVPEEFVYWIIKECDDGLKLDQMTSMFEIELSKYQKGIKEYLSSSKTKEKQKTNFFSKLFKF